MRCSSFWVKSVAGVALLFAVGATSAHAEDASAAWLRYAPVSNAQAYAELPSRIFVRGNTPIDVEAANELKRGLSALLGREFTAEVAPPLTDKDLDAAKDGRKTRSQGPAIRISSISEMKEHFKVLEREQPLGAEEYQIIFGKLDGQMLVTILGGTPRGELYGVFHLLEEIAAQQPIPAD